MGGPAIVEIQGSAAWAVALKSGRRPTDGSPVSLPEAFAW